MAAAWKMAVLAATMIAAPISAVHAGSIRWDLAGSFNCVGFQLGREFVKLKCVRETRHGNRIFTSVANFSVRGPVAGQYIGKHEGCTHVPASETRWNQDFIACPGIPVWWKKR